MYMYMSASWIQLLDLLHASDPVLLRLEPGGEVHLSGLIWRGLKRKLPETFAPPKMPSFAFFCSLPECSRKLFF